MATRIKTETRPSDGLREYHELVRRHPLRPIRSDQELQQSVEFLNALPHCDELTEAEEDYKLVLADLIWRYETEHDPEPQVSHDQMLRSLIEAKGISQASLASNLGISESTVSEILAGKRAISLRNRKLFAGYFRVDPAVFV